MNDPIPPIRHATRALVRELHLLDGRVECCGLPLAECHLITELSSIGEATATDLCERLVLEKSTMSRLVNRLVDKGLVCAACCADDRRARILCLTAEGRKRAAELDRHASAQALAALEFLDDERSQAAIEGINAYARALRHARKSRGCEIRPIRPSDDKAVAGLLREVMTEYGAVGEDYPITDPEIDHMHAAYRGPRAGFFVVVKDGDITGCGGFGPLPGAEDEVCELRKMYFRPELRGRGMGSRLLRTILDAARAAGYRRCYLETMHNMDQARALYRKHGFQGIAAPLGKTGHGGCNRFMILDL